VRGVNIAGCLEKILHIFLLFVQNVNLLGGTYLEKLNRKEGQKHNNFGVAKTEEDYKKEGKMKRGKFGLFGGS